MKKPFIVLGKGYESIRSAERSLGLGSGTVRYWLKYNSYRAQFLKEGQENVIGK